MARGVAIDFRIIAEDQATAKLRALRAELQQLSNDTDKIIRQQGAWAGGRYIEKQTAATRDLIAQNMALLRSYEMNAQAAQRASAALFPSIDSNRNKQIAAQFAQVGESIKSVGTHSGFAYREVRHLVAAFDEFASGRRGQLMSTIGASIRDAGVGANILVPGVIALAAVMGGAAIIRGAAAMGEMAEKMRAGAAASGMAVSEFSKIQGALVLLGEKAESTDAQLRHFAIQLATGLAEPSSRAAISLRALGISHEELAAKGSSTAEMFNRVVSILSRYPDDFNKAAIITELFGRNTERIGRAAQDTGHSITELEDKARSIGIALDDLQSKALAETGQRLTLLHETIHGAVIQSFLSWKGAIDTVVGGIQSLIDSMGRLKEVLPALGAAPFTGIGYPLYKALSQETPVATADLPPPIPGPGLPSTLGQAGAMQQIRERIQSAREAAAIRGGANTRALHEAETRAEIQTIQQSLKEFDLSEKEKSQLRAEESRARVSLLNQEAAGAAKAARQNYLDFAGAERLKIQEQRGNIQAITATYDEWIAKARSVYGQEKSEIEKLQRERLRAIQEAQQQAVQMQLQDAERLITINHSMLTKFEADMESMVKRRQITQTQALGFDIQYATQQWEEAKRRLEAAMGAPGASAEQRLQAYEHLLTGGAQSEATTSRLSEQIAAEGKKTADAWAKPFIQGVDKIGSAFESALSGVVSGQKNIAQRFAQQMATAITDMVGGALSRVVASALGATGGETLGSFLGKGITGALDLGMIFAKGGWDVPSFQGGGTSSGGLAILHPREMVLPAYLADTVRRASSAMPSFGGATNNNSASVNMNTTINGSGRIGPSEMRNILRDHGDSMAEHMSRLVRDGFRPSGRI